MLTKLYCLSFDCVLILTHTIATAIVVDIPQYTVLWKTLLPSPLQIIQKRFSDFSRDLLSSVDRVESVYSSADSLIKAGHTGV